MPALASPNFQLLFPYHCESVKIAASQLPLPESGHSEEKSL